MSAQKQLITGFCIPPKTTPEILINDCRMHDSFNIIRIHSFLFTRQCWNMLCVQKAVTVCEYKKKIKIRPQILLQLAHANETNSDLNSYLFIYKRKKRNTMELHRYNNRKYDIIYYIFLAKYKKRLSYILQKWRDPL